ncbi:GTPase IMAP family member 9-like [Myxocyprinus asiaticus]|uniref:GTPase IMAP family member 9-like n=1 Tax=Myxocyprinus asiaticus TaxID=70543 RepID=UPI0022214BE9|nr:GTPase IMAP family member 9-like [Myxocyprinus asiaticus]
MAGAHTDLRIVLLGKTGSGKSATGNTILNRNMFQENVVTQICVSRKAVVGQKAVTIIDTPGLFNPSVSEEELVTKIKKCARMCAPGPHVFLLVIRLDMGLTDEEKNIVTWIQNNFGNDASRFVFILFTHADQLNGESLDEHIRENDDLQALINSCGGRYHSFNNRNRANRVQVTELMQELVRFVRDNSGYHYNLQGDNMPQEGNNVELVDNIVVILGTALGLILLLATMTLKR